MYKFRNRHRVLVWGDLAKIVNDEYSKFPNDEKVIVILTSTKMATYKGIV